MPSRKDCLDDIAKRTGRKRAEVDELADAIDARAQDYEESGGLGPDESYARARDEMLNEIAERGALARRAEIMDTRKEIARHRYYRDVERQIVDKIGPLVGKRTAARLARGAARIALEAKLVGVNLPFLKNRLSVDAQYVAMRRLWVGGMSADLEKAGLLKVFATRTLEDKWTDELFELNKRLPGGTSLAQEGAGARPGVTGDAQALAIAKIVQKWQRQAMASLNREGAWVRSYSGYITRSSHDADAIRDAGPEKWVYDTIGTLDLKRTFGTDDRQRALDALRQMWTPLKDGDHFDYGKPLDEPMYPSTAKQVSAARELHFKNGAAWRKYNDAYGVHNATRTVIEALSTGARRTALMKEFGTRPAEAFDRDLNYRKAELQQESKRNTTQLGMLSDLQESSPTPERAAKIGDLNASIEAARGKFEDFSSWEQPLRNRFAQIDGSSKRPVSRTLANLANNWMAIQRMAKLGRVALTHFASLPTKAAEARYWGIPFTRRYGSLFSGMTSGAEGSAKREALNATLAGLENRLGHMMSMYDVADAPHGFLAKWESTFFKLTGVSSVTENQRGDSEAMFAAHIGSKRGLAWDQVGPKEQRVLQGFGLGEAEWKALAGVEWSKFGDRTYLTPSDALKLSDEQTRAYLKETEFAKLSRGEPTADDIGKAREDLATTLAAAYTDRAGYAIPMPSARIRAMMFGKNFEPGTAINTAMRLMYQFKLWPMDMIVRAWGREMYGTIGDGKLDRVAGLAEMLVGGIVFGVASESVREAIQGHNPIPQMEAHPFAWIEKGALRSGMGSILGDFLLGEYDRHGLSAVANLAGPTFSQIDTLMGILHGSGDSILETAFGGNTQETKRQHPWRTHATSLLKLAHDNTPFMNLWATGLAMDTLVWHRLQEWINPGYLKRAQRRQEQQSGTQFWLSPAKTDQWLTGRAASPL